MWDFNLFISLLSLPWRKIIIIIAFQMHRLVDFHFSVFALINAEIIRNLCWQGRNFTWSYELFRFYNVYVIYYLIYIICNTNLYHNLSQQLPYVLLQWCHPVIGEGPSGFLFLLYFHSALCEAVEVIIPPAASTLLFSSPIQGYGPELSNIMFSIK